MRVAGVEALRAPSSVQVDLEFRVAGVEALRAPSAGLSLVQRKNDRPRTPIIRGTGLVLILAGKAQRIVMAPLFGRRGVCLSPFVSLYSLVARQQLRSKHRRRLAERRLTNSLSVFDLRSRPGSAALHPLFCSPQASPAGRDTVSNHIEHAMALPQAIQFSRFPPMESAYVKHTSVTKNVSKLVLLST